MDRWHERVGHTLHLIAMASAFHQKPHVFKFWVQESVFPKKKRVRLSTNHHSQTSKKVGALCIGYEYSFFSLGMKKRKNFRPKFYNLFDAYEQKNNFLKFRDEKGFFVFKFYNIFYG